MKVQTLGDFIADEGPHASVNRIDFVGMIILQHLQEKMLQFLLRIRSTVEGDELKAVQVIGAKSTLVLRWVVAVDESDESFE